MYSDIILSMSTKGTIYSNMHFLYVLFRSAWQWPMSQYESYKPARQLRNILVPTRWSYPVLLPSHRIITSPVSSSSTREPFRNGWIRSQWGALRSWPSIWCGVPTSPGVPALNAGGPERLMDHMATAEKTWRELDPYRHTYTYVYIYMYIYVCLHIYVHIICICWSCPFLCVNVCVSI